MTSVGIFIYMLGVAKRLHAQAFFDTFEQQPRSIARVDSGR